MNFKEWLRLKETSTSTASIAGFARPSIPLVRRGGNLDFMTTGHDPFFDKKKKKKKRD